MWFESQGLASSVSSVASGSCWAEVLGAQGRCALELVLVQEVRFACDLRFSLGIVSVEGAFECCTG